MIKLIGGGCCEFGGGCCFGGGCGPDCGGGCCSNDDEE